MSAIFVFSSGSVTIIQRQSCRFDAVGACTASSRHSISVSRSTGRSKSSRLRTDRGVERRRAALATSIVGCASGRGRGGGGGGGGVGALDGGRVGGGGVLIQAADPRRIYLTVWDRRRGGTRT